MVFILSLMLLIFSGISEAGELWTKYDIGDSTINSLSNFGEYIWIATQNKGLIKLNRFNSSQRNFTIEDGLPKNSVTFVNNDNCGLVYAGSSYLVSIDDNYLKDYSSKLVFQYKNIDFGDSLFYAKPNYISSISVSKDNIIYVAANYIFSIGGNNIAHLAQIFSYNGDYWDVIYTNSSREGFNLINCTALTIDGKIIMGQNWPEPYSIKAIAVDKIGGIWRSHSNAGQDVGWAEYFLDGSTTQYDSTNSLLTSLINYIVIDRDNTAWFGGKNLVSYDGSEWKIYSADGWNENTKINAMTIDVDGYIWVGTQSDGLFRFDAKNATAIQTAHQSPAEFTLSAAYPNPFNAQTTISFDLTKPAKVNLSIYSLTGQKVRELTAGAYSAGKYTSVWDGKNEIGETVSSGLYLARMESGGASKVVRMAMVK